MKRKKNYVLHGFYANEHLDTHKTFSADCIVFFVCFEEYKLF